MKKGQKDCSFSKTDNKLGFLLLFAALLFLSLFLVLSLELFNNNKVDQYDQRILTFIGEHIRAPQFNSIALNITSLGSPSIIGIISIVALLILIFLHDRKGIYYYLTNVLGATLWIFVLKNMIHRERPQLLTHLEVVSGKSYPSGHSLIAAATFCSLAFLINSHTKILALRKLNFLIALALVILISFSRLYLGVHYPSDIISGIFVGLSWVFFVTTLFQVKIA
jgi:membrane-associated phospholipid phosphatase